MCWFEGGLTDSFGPPLQPLMNALGWLPGSFCPHFDGEDGRRQAYHSAVLRGALPPGIACDDGVAAVYVDGELLEYVGEVAGAGCYAVDRVDGEVIETARPVRLLGA